MIAVLVPYCMITHIPVGIIDGDTNCTKHFVLLPITLGEMKGVNESNLTEEIQPDLQLLGI